LPEHPRPDFERREWLNLNGRWDFAFDKRTRESGPAGARAASVCPTDPRAVLLGCAGVRRPDSAEIGWYSRSITIPERWRGRRVYLVVGASDWRTSVWLDGTKVGEHQGGYVPFSVS
jgi:beta-galactosidase/beta-glucuronidase